MTIQLRLTKLVKESPQDSFAFVEQADEKPLDGDSTVDTIVIGELRKVDDSHVGHLIQCGHQKLGDLIVDLGDEGVCCDECCKVGG